MKTIYKSKYICSEKFDKWLIDHSIIVENGSIIDVLPTSTLPEKNELKIHDLGDVYLIPGLIETHAHMHVSATHDALDILLNETREQLLLRASENLKKAIYSGVTTLRDIGSREPQYGFEIIEAARKETERLGVYLTAHTLSDQSTKFCVDAGVHNLIHSRFLSKNPSKKYGDYSIELFSKIAEKGLFVEPTIGAELLRVEAEKEGLPMRKPNWSVAESPITTQDMIDQFTKMEKEGVKLTGGLDMGMAYATFDKSAASAWAMVEFLGNTPWNAIKKK